MFSYICLRAGTDEVKVVKAPSCFWAEKFLNKKYGGEWFGRQEDKR